MLATDTVLQNRYRIVSLLGQGGMGAVYRAWHLSLDIPVALKEMVPQPGLDASTLGQLRAQFRREAAIVARMHHANLVRVLDFFEEGGNAYLVMELVEGESLADRIARAGAPPEAEVLTWAGQLLDALAYCHSQGVIHRDVKPQNVIIRPDGQAVLVDFGLVKLWDPHDPQTRTAMRGMGTPEYAPPEQYGAQPGHTDPRSDLYSLGATIYHALTGQAPRTASERIAFPEQFIAPRQLNARVSAETEAWVLRAMELSVARRFQSAAEMRAALPDKTTVLPEMAVRTRVLPASQTRALPRPARRVAWLPILAVLALLAVAVGGISLVAWGLGRALQTAQTPVPTDAVPSPLPTAAPVTPPPTAAPVETPTATATPIPPLIHYVREGDTLAGIAAQYGTTVEAILALNPDIAVNSLRPGQALLIPIEPGAVTPPLVSPFDTWIRPADGMVMVWVPGGEFQMGSTESEVDDAMASCYEYDCERAWYTDELPMHTVALDGFWIDQTEVTNAQYAQCVAVGACSPLVDRHSHSRESYYDNATYAAYPVIWVSWDEAVNYCAWTGGRLPTEAEWEYAARGPERRIFPWGSVFDGTALNYCDANCDGYWADTVFDDGYADTSPVGSYLAGASWAGVLDMAGNVWEWTADWFSNYPSEPQMNPAGPSSGDRRVLRGGSWGSDPSGVRAANRISSAPDLPDSSYGFRCARDP